MTRPTRLRAPPTTTLVSTLALLAALLVLPLTLAPRAEAFVYWTNPATSPCYRECSGPAAIGRANLDGTGVTQRFIELAAPAGGIAVDAEHLYWGDEDGIARANLDGTGVDAGFITTGHQVGGIALDAGNIYWNHADGIGRANLDGTGVDAGFITTAESPAGVAIDVAHVYWANPNAGTIGRANLDGTGIDQSFITVPPFSPISNNRINDVGVDANHVYWTQLSRIGRANLDGTGIEPNFIWIGGPVEGTAVAADVAHLYWRWSVGGPPGGHAIGRANLDGTGVTAAFIWLAGVAPQGPTDLAVNFSLGKLKKANNKGTAKLKLEVPAPGEIALAQTNTLKGAEVRADAAGEVQLAIKPRGKAKKKLAKQGKVKVGVEVTYTPDGGEPEEQTTALKLIKRG